jgi:hypothetical protein
VTVDLLRHLGVKVDYAAVDWDTLVARVQQKSPPNQGGWRAPLMFFEGRCKDKETLRKLIALANDRSRCKQAHALFSEIRPKTLAAEQRNDQLALAHDPGKRVDSIALAASHDSCPR